MCTNRKDRPLYISRKYSGRRPINNLKRLGERALWVSAAVSTIVFFSDDGKQLVTLIPKGRVNVTHSGWAKGEVDYVRGGWRFPKSCPPWEGSVREWKKTSDLVKVEFEENLTRVSPKCEWRNRT